MKQSIWLLTIATATLSACGQSSKPSVSNPADVQLHAEAMSGHVLSASEKANFKSFMTSSAAAPSLDLYFNGYNSAAEKFAELASLTDKGHAEIDLVKTSCAVKAPTESVSGNSNVAGQTFVTTSIASIGDLPDAPGKCPMLHSAKIITTTTYTSLDQAQRIATGTSHSEANANTIYNDVDLASIPFANLTSTSSSDINLQGVQKSNGEITAGTETSSTRGRIQSDLASGQTAKILYVVHRTHSAGHVTHKMLFKFTLPGVATTAVLGLFQTDNGVAEVILNSEKYTADQLKADMGLDVKSMLHTY